MTRPETYITITSGPGGFHPIKVRLLEDNICVPVETGPLAAPSLAEAIEYGILWADEEDLCFFEPGDGKGLFHFHANAVIPKGMMALVKLTETGPETIWFGPTNETPEDALQLADEAHVHPDTYAALAAKLEATGKGVPCH
jgi:hypothetical protein